MNAEIKTKKEKRVFHLIIDDKETEHKFVSMSPMSAAKKAVNAGFSVFGLRCSGEERVHLFDGRIEWVKAPEKLPVWIKPNVEGLIKKAVVKKVGIKRL